MEEVLSWFGLTGSAGGSMPPALALFSVLFFLLVVFSFIKNRMLATTESGRSADKKGSFMRKIKKELFFVLASVSEVVVALGASHVASAVTLPQTNFHLTHPSSETPNDAPYIKRWV